MSINAIGGGYSSYQFGMGPSDPIKPETRQKLKELGIDENSVKTETQAKAKIKEKEEQIKKAIQQKLQEQAATQSQAAQAGTQVQQTAQAGGVDKADKVDGINKSQQIDQAKGAQEQNAINNQRQGDEQVKAFAASQGAKEPKQAQQAQPFDNEKDLLAMYKKLQLGLM